MRDKTIVQCYVFVLAIAVATGAVAHTGSHDVASGRLDWSFDPLVLGSIAIAGFLYTCGARRLARHSRSGLHVVRRRALYFGLGIVTALAALVSPIDALGSVLFSAHMVQHELLMLVVAPLLVLGRPAPVFLWAFPSGARPRIAGAFNGKAMRGLWHAVFSPAGAWGIHAAVLWAWHFPSLFQASLSNQAVHTLQHVSFLGSALLFWASLIGGQSARQAGVAVLSLLTTAIHTGMLGALLTFSSTVWYRHYEVTAPIWGLAALDDQQLGGLIMWVPAGFIFVIAGLAMASKAIGMALSARPDVSARARR